MRVIVLLVGLALCLVGLLQALDANRTYGADPAVPLAMIGLGVLCLLGAAA